MLERLGRFHDPARMAIQTGVASVVTLELCRLLGFQQLTWGVMSALFVIQMSVGGTVGMAIYRILGTALGTAAGVMAVLVVPATPLPQAITLFVVGSGLVFVAGIWPGLRFGAIAAAILIVAPPPTDLDVLAAAGSQAAQILLGTVVATVTSRLILPDSAHRQSARSIARLLTLCADLLETVTGELRAGKRDDDRLAGINRGIVKALEEADQSSAQSRRPLERRWARWRGGERLSDPDKIVRCAQHLWHTLLIAQRTGGERLAGEPRQILDEPLWALSEDAGGYLRDLARAIRTNDPVPPLRPVLESQRRMEEAFAEVRRRSFTLGLSAREAERVFALSLAINHLGSNLGAMAELVRTAPPAGSRS
jgi:uncharacterized membrane protein YccC